MEVIQRAEEEARQRAELEARQKAEEEARQKAEIEARHRAEEEARLRLAEEARLKAELEAKQIAEREAWQKAELEAIQMAEEEAKKRAQEARLKEIESAMSTEAPIVQNLVDMNNSVTALPPVAVDEFDSFPITVQPVASSAPIINMNNNQAQSLDKLPQPAAAVNGDVNGGGETVAVVATNYAKERIFHSNFIVMILVIR